MAKTKALISCAVTAYANRWFSHAKVTLLLITLRLSMNGWFKTFCQLYIAQPLSFEYFFKLLPKDRVAIFYTTVAC